MTAAILRHPEIAVMVVASLCARPALAQHDAALRAGVTVRVERRIGVPPTVRGSLVARDSFSVVLSALDDPSRLTSIALTDIRRLEVAESRRTAGQAFRRGARRGALVGLGLSAGLMVIGVVDDRRQNDSWISGKALAAIGGVVVTTFTTITGGLIGLTSRERWQRIPLEAGPVRRVQ